MTDCKADMYSLIITDKFDNTFRFDVDDTLQIEIAQNKVSFESTQNGSTFQLDELKRIGYEVIHQTGIKLPYTAIPKFFITSDHIYFSTQSEEEKIYSIYTSAGDLVAKNKFITEGHIDLSSFNQGIYIIKIGAYPSFKFAVK